MSRDCLPRTAACTVIAAATSFAAASPADSACTSCGGGIGGATVISIATVSVDSDASSGGGGGGSSALPGETPDDADDALFCRATGIPLLVTGSWPCSSKSSALAISLTEFREPPPPVEARTRARVQSMTTARASVGPSRPPGGDPPPREGSRSGSPLEIPQMGRGVCAREELRTGPPSLCTSCCRAPRFRVQSHRRATACMRTAARAAASGVIGRRGSALIRDSVLRTERRDEVPPPKSDDGPRDWT